MSIVRGKKILITGVSGFLGSALARELYGDNQVYGLARFRNPEIKRELESLGITCITKDILTEDLDDLPEDIDYVFSQLVQIAGCDQDQKLAYATNAYFAGRLMQRYHNVRGIVLGSTGSVYKPSTEPVREDGTIGPIATYGASKLAGEVLGTFLSTLWNIPTCILRYCYPYSGQGGLLYLLARRIVQGKPIQVGRQQLSYYDPIHISDCIRFTIQSVEFCSVPPRVLNVAGVEVLGWGDLVDRMSKALGATPNLVEQDADVPALVVDISRLIELIGEPRVKLKEGIAEVAQAIKAGGTAREA